MRSLGEAGPQGLIAGLEDRFAGVDFAELKGFSSWPGLVAPADVVGPDDTDLGAQLAKARRKLNRGRRVPDEVLLKLEDAVRTLRPALPVSGGRLAELPEELAKLFAGWASFRNAIRPYLRSVARIDIGDRGTLASAFATGWLVRDGVLVTNAHVAKALTKGTTVLPAGHAVARFGEESAPVATRRPTPIKRVIAIHPRDDLALLEVPRAKTRRALVLGDSEARPKRQVAAIGYPSADDQAPEYADLMFDDTYGVERVSPGQVLANGSAGTFLHDCTTLEGNSGSPIVDLADGEVLGVHREGYYLAQNEAVPVRQVREFVDSQC